MGVVAFWIALAAVLIAGGWAKSRSEAEKHETLRKLIEKGGAVDEAQIRALFYPPPSATAPWWVRKRVPGDSFRGLRAVGTVAICFGLGLSAFFAPLWRWGGEEDAVVGVGFGVAIFALGVGLFLASGFMQRPVRDGAAPRAVE